MVETRQFEDDAALLYGDEGPGGHMFLQDADILDHPDFMYGAPGMEFHFILVGIDL